MMRRMILSIAFLIGSMSDAGALSGSVSAAGARPNVVIIYGDDVGYADVEAYGSKLIPTPNIDRLAAEGLRFTDGHCVAATCTPSRYSLLTGEYGFRSGAAILPPGAPLIISTNALTLPKLFKKAGYKTGIVGKWHLGLGIKGVPTDWNGDVKPGPLEVGFDVSFLLPSTGDRVPSVYLLGHRVLNLDPADPLYIGTKEYVRSKTGSTQYPIAKENPEAMTYYRSTHGHDCSVINGIGRIGFMAGGKSALWNDETIADVFVEQAKAFLAENKNEPFLLYFSAQDIHVPRAPHPRFQGKTKLGYRGDAMVQFDWSTGEILKTLDELGLKENTLVIFSSDNGPVYDDGYDDGTTVKPDAGEVDRGHDASGLYRGGKYQIYEGGTRVPLIVRWPGKIKPGVSDALVNQIDFIASFAALLNIELADDEAPDSRNALDALLGNDPVGHDLIIEEARRVLALRRGDWKYIAPSSGRAGDTRAELYNLKEDPVESNNLIEENPEVAGLLAKKLQELVDAGRMRD